MTKQNQNTWLFIGFLLLAGFTNMIGRFLPIAWDALMNCIQYVLYTGLLIFWLEVVRIRLLPSRARTHMHLAARFMLLYMFLRFFRYSFAVTTGAIRYATYAYWIPQMLISTLFLMTCIRIRRGKQKPGKGNEALLLVPAVFLSIMAMTNDLHGLVYIPRIPLSQFVVDTGTYAYGVGFYLLNAWMILTTFAGLFVLLVQAGRLPRRTVFFQAGDIALWFGILLLDLLVLYPHTNIRIINTPEASIFGMLGIFEISIRGRLIPYNENYTGFFEKLRMPVLITDRELKPVYASAGMIKAEPEELNGALHTPIYPEPDHRLSGKEISAGYAFWMEDETEVHRMQERLMEANEMIEQENTLIEAETKQKEENAYLSARHRIYHEIAEEMYPVQRRIGELLADTVPGTERYKDRIALISILNAYVKRKTNLLLLAAEKETLSSYELYLALEESAGYLAYQDLRVSVEETTEQEYPAKELIAFYDAFERIAEQLIGKAPSLMVAFKQEGLYLAAKTDQVPDTAGIPLPVYFHESDGILYMDIAQRKGGAAV